MTGAISHEHYMREALKEAQKAYDAKESPIGALIVHNKRVVARAHNQVEMLKDATAHAEMIAITQAANTLGDWRLSEATLYVTKEPCTMCSGAMVLSRVKHLVFGAADPRGGGAGSAHNIVADKRSNHRVAVHHGVLQEECREILQAFFREQRQRTH